MYKRYNKPNYICNYSKICDFVTNGRPVLLLKSFLMRWTMAIDGFTLRSRSATDFSLTVPEKLLRCFHAQVVCSHSFTGKTVNFKYHLNAT